MPDWQQDPPYLHDEAWKALGGKHCQGDQVISTVAAEYVLLH